MRERARARVCQIHRAVVTIDENMAYFSCLQLTEKDYIQSRKQTNDKFKFRNYIWQCVVVPERVCTHFPFFFFAETWNRVPSHIFCGTNMTEIRNSRKAFVKEKKKLMSKNRHGGGH